MAALLAGTTGNGTPLVQAEATAFLLQLKDYLANNSGSSSLTMEVRAALCGAILSNLPEKISENATRIPEIFNALARVYFQYKLCSAHDIILLFPTSS